MPKLNQAGLGKTICCENYSKLIFANEFSLSDAIPFFLATRTPFQIRFVSDSFEFLPEAAKQQRGFR